MHKFQAFLSIGAISTLLFATQRLNGEAFVNSIMAYPFQEEIAMSHVERASSMDTLKLHPSAELFVLEELAKPERLLRLMPTPLIFEQLSRAKMEQISNLPDSLVYFGKHPFLLGMLQAYQEHRLIVISPDIIWLLIEQGFARHMAIHAEKFRDKLVDFDGKRELTVVVDDRQIAIGKKNSKWESIFPQFVDQIETYTGVDLCAEFTIRLFDHRCKQ